MKPFYTSKTVWFNALTIITVIATMFGYVPDQELAENTSAILLSLTPLINLALRFVTTKPIK
jgi:hypothetical protein